MAKFWELCESAGAAGNVDREANVIRGVKVLGLTSRNKRNYRESALKEALDQYNGAAVCVDHGNDPGGVRAYGSQIGVLRDVRLVEGQGLFGDLHFNPHHVLSSQLAYDAEHNPNRIGLSHAIEAEVGRENGGQVVNRINRVYSVDLVTRPATTAGLFESEDGMPDGEQEASPIDVCLGKLREVFDGEGDAKAKLSAATEILRAALGLQDAMDNATGETKPAEESEQVKADDTATKLTEAEARVQLAESERDDYRLLAEHAIKPTEARVKALAAVTDEAARSELIESWKVTEAAARPRSGMGSTELTTEQFVSRVKRGL